MAKTAGPIFCAAALAACVPAPVLANENRADEVARKLDDPMTQYMVAGAGDVVPGVPAGATLGELAGPQAERLPRQIMQRVPRLMDSLAGLANAYGDMEPQLEAMAKRLKDKLPHN